jgi:ribosomal protein S18
MIANQVIIESLLVSAQRSIIARNFCQASIKFVESQNDEPVQMENPFKKEKVKCILCKYNIEPNYKNVQLLSQFQSPYTGRIYGRHITGLCKKMQEKVEKQIAIAQEIAFMGFMTKEPKFLKDEKLFDPERPIRPHKY